MLRTLGRLDEAVGAYRKSVELDPGLGDPWWSLSNLKTYRFSAEDVAAMQAQLDRKDSTDDNRLLVHFALGKAYEDAAAYAAVISALCRGEPSAPEPARLPSGIDHAFRAAIP